MMMAKKFSTKEIKITLQKKLSVKKIKENL